MTQKIEITRQMKLLMIEALKNGFIDSDKGQVLSDALSILNPFEKMRLNHNIPIDKKQTP